MNRFSLLILVLILLSSCSNKKDRSVFYTSDNPAERVVWERIRLADPNTGEIPKNIRKKEMNKRGRHPDSSAGSGLLQTVAHKWTRLSLLTHPDVCN